jgi:aminobenzoyl-glutamate utilization protein B
VISLGSDIDDIPQASQKPGVAWHDPMIEGAPGHGEGHNSGVPLNIVAALAVKKIMEREHLQGTIQLWPGVAEELVGGKAQFVRAGLFKNVDIVLFCHVANNFGVSYGPAMNQNGLVSIEYLFKGESAHAAAAPWRGRSALDAVELMDVGWNFRREHLRLAQRSHYVITDGGDQPNVVPPTASVWYYFREADYDHIMDMWRIGDNMAKAATLMTDTTYASRLLGSAWPGYFSKPIAEAMYENIKKVGLPVWSDDDQKLAKGLQTELKAPVRGLATKIPAMRPPPPTPDPADGSGDGQGQNVGPTGGGSDDIGDVSWNVPGRAGTQLGQWRLHGYADCAQRCGGRRQGAGADDARHPARSRTGEERLGLFQRADQGCEVQELPASRRQARHLVEPENHADLSRPHEAVLLRPV